MKRMRRFTALAAVGVLLGAGLGASSAQDVLEKAAAVPKLIGPADLDCSFFVMEAVPRLRISEAIQGGERTLFSDGDLFFVDPVPGTETFAEDSLWTILEPGPRVRGQNPPGWLGTVVHQRGRARVVRVESGRAVMEIVRSCGMITAGLALVPYVKGDVLTGREADYNVPFREGDAVTGRVVFIESDWSDIIARGHWALVDIGADKGLVPGTQLTLFRPEGKKTPRAYGNSVVVWTGARWATVKILDGRDAVLDGDLVQVRPI